MVIKTDLLGVSEWRRLDNFKDPTEAGTTVSTSAAEYISPGPNGAFLIVTDELLGIGAELISTTGAVTVPVYNETSVAVLVTTALIIFFQLIGRLNFFTKRLNEVQAIFNKVSD